jgi:SpoVK/Ycf46/Vps4 family AAA+-type ATPase
LTADLERGDKPLSEVESGIQKRSHDAFIKSVLTRAVDELSIPRRYRGRLLRKATAKITRDRSTPTTDSAKSMLRWLENKQLQAESDRETGRNRTATTAEIIEDVRSLIVRPDSLDFSDVAGMKTVKEQLAQAIESELDPEKRASLIHYTGGTPPDATPFLLYGAPGGGKTHIVQAAAGEFAQRYGLSVIYVPDIAVKGFAGQRKLRRLRKIFDLARELAPVIVVWDEFDSIAADPRRQGREPVFDITTTFKREFEGAFSTNEIILHIATTNYPWSLEPALIRGGRMEGLFHVAPSDLEARIEAWEIFTERRPLHANVDIHKLAAQTEGMTHVEIKSVINAATRAVTKRAAGALDQVHTQEDFIRQIEARPPQDYETWLADAKAALTGRYANRAKKFPELMGLFQKDSDKTPR